MPRRRTARGNARTPLGGDWDVLVCGASFAGLARRPAARGLRAPACSLVDRYEIGERQTSACAAPDRVARRRWASPTRSARRSASWSSTPRTSPPGWASRSRSRPSTTRSCARACSRRATRASRPQRSRAGRARSCIRIAATSSAPLVVDALGWRRILAPPGYQPPDAPLSRGLEVHPWGASDELEIWIDRSYVPAGYGWSFPATDEVRVGVGSFDPRFHVKEPTVRLADDLERERRPLPGQLDPAPPAPRGRRRGLLRRRLGRPLPAADRRGHPHRLLLRHRVRQRAARGRVRPRVSRRRAAPLRLVLGLAPLEVRGDAARPAARPAGPAAAARARAARDEHRCVRPLVVRALPRDRTAGLWLAQRARARRGRRSCARRPTA